MGGTTNTELRQKIETLEKEIQTLKAHQLDAASQESQTRYKKLFNSASLGIFLIDAQSKIVDANRQALKLLGYTFEEITCMALEDMIHPDNLNAQPIITTEDIADAEYEITLERYYLCKSGRYLPAEVHLRAFHDGMMIATFQDISRRIASDRALRAANEALEVLYQCANAAIVSLDRDMCVNFWNPAAEKMFGWTQEEVVGKPYPAVPDDMKEAFQNFFKDNMLGGQSFTDMEVLRRRKDGSRFYVSATSGPTRNERGEITGLISVMIDITRRKEAEVALQQSEERYRSLVENTQDGYFICDVTGGQFRFLNQRMCDLFNFAPDEAIHLTLWDILSEKYHDAMQSLINEQYRKSTNGSASMTFQAVRKDGTTFRTEISVSMVTYEEKPVIQCLLRNITERERLRAKLQQAQRLESIGTLAGGVAHDFNNLLMAIQGNASLALTQVDPGTGVYGKLKNITTCVQDAASLTKQLLGFARGGKYEVKPTDLNTLVEKTAQMFGRTKKEISIKLILQSDIWTVAVDRGQIEQVLLNLLVNGWQAMPNGGKIDIQTANVVLDAAYADPYNIKPGNYVKTSVIDSGIGMDKAVQDKIFEPFFTTKDRTRGTGLGLASAYGIIKNHDGIINVYSEPGKGATFTFHLPVVQKVLSKNVENDQKKLAGSETVLLVDDEEMVIETTREMLEELGYRTRMASSGETGLEIYHQEQNDIDIVLLDMIMPGMGGSETFNQLLKIDPNVKVLLSSGYSLDGSASDIMRRGCKGFIQKPFNIEELSRKIREILDNPSSRVSHTPYSIRPHR